MNAVYGTQRLWLCELTEADAPSLFELDSDPEVMRFIGPLALDNVEAYRRRIVEQFQSTYAMHPGMGVFAAIEKASGDFLGWFHWRPALLFRFSQEAGYQTGDVDLGYRLRRSAWGKGFATEGAQMFMQSGCGHSQIERVVAVTLATNIRSIRVLEKVGLSRDREFTLPGYETPALRFSRTLAASRA